MYHLEFLGLPAQTALQPLLRQVAAVVDRRLTPAAYARNPQARPAGVSLSLLALPPAVGGFGLLPLVAQVRALRVVACLSMLTSVGATALCQLWLRCGPRSRPGTCSTATVGEGVRVAG